MGEDVARTAIPFLFWIIAGSWIVLSLYLIVVDPFP